MVQSGIDDCVLAIGEGWLEYLGYDAVVYSLHLCLFSPSERVD